MAEYFKIKNDIKVAMETVMIESSVIHLVKLQETHINQSLRSLSAVRSFILQRAKI